VVNIVLSRNPTVFMRRHGMVDEPVRPSPRLDVSALLVHSIPLKSPANPSQLVLRQLEGSPSPDRGLSRPWPMSTQDDT